MAKNGTLAKIKELQPSFQTTTEQITIGIDLGDRFSHCCVLGPDGKILARRWKILKMPLQLSQPGHFAH